MDRLPPVMVWPSGNRGGHRQRVVDGNKPASADGPGSVHRRGVQVRGDRRNVVRTHSSVDGSVERFLAVALTAGTAVGRRRQHSYGSISTLGRDHLLY